MPYSDEFKRFFQFSQSERKGIFVLILILFALVGVLQIDFLPLDNQLGLRHSSLDTSVFFVDKSSNPKRYSNHAIASSVKIKSKKETFFLDPNKADASAMIAIGIYPNIAERIIKYRAKGGQFKVNADVKKIFGFTEKLYTRVGAKLKVDTSLFVKSKVKSFTIAPTFTQLEKPIAAANYNINTMGFKALVQLLDDSLSVIQILKYKVALGGYYDLQQLKEINGLNDSAYQTLILKCTIKSDAVFRKINLNLAEAYELRRHPYIKYKLAQLIIAYRQNRTFQSIDELKKIPTVDEALFNKLKYYVFVRPNE